MRVLMFITGLVAAVAVWWVLQPTPAATPEVARLPPPPAGPSGQHELVVAGGCFWCVEAVFEQLAGVEEAVSGFAGGTAETARYELVAAGKTDHAEAVRIRFDPSRIGYGQLLRVFVALHDPTQVDRQGPDVGAQYRSAVFVHDEREKQIVRRFLQAVAESGVYEKPLATAVEDLDGFHAADASHQDFVAHNPEHPYVTRYALPKVRKVRAWFPELVQAPETTP